MVFCTASDSNGGHGAFCESTSQTFRRGKDPDTDGSWRTEGAFSVMMAACGKTERVLYLL